MRAESITSRENRHVKQAVRLMSSGRARREEGLFVLEGLRLCLDAVSSGAAVEAAFFTPQAALRHPEIERLAQAARRSFETSPEVFARLTDTVTPQGVACICKIPEAALSPESLDPAGRYLACENLADPANLGAMARTAEALGADGLLLLGSCCDPYSPKAQRAAMGSLLRIGLCAAGSAQTALPLLRERGLRVYAAVVDRDAEPVGSVTFGPGSVILIGNEGAGLGAETAALCDRRVTIPIRGRAESLNAAAAAAILLWELLK